MPLSMPYPWKFVRRGGFDQVILDSGEDIFRLGDLDQKLWATLSSPVTGLEFDARTLALIAPDNDGRIRVGDILATIAWLSSVFTSADILTTPGDTLPLSLIRTDTPEGRALLTAAGELLATLGKPDDTSLSLDEAADALQTFLGTPFNGDGIITAAALPQPEQQEIFGRIVTATGGVLDEAGVTGLTRELLDAFVRSLEETIAVRTELFARSRSIWGDNDDDDALRARMARYETLAPKIDDFFLRQALASYDNSATEALNPTYEQYRQITQNGDAHALGVLPLAIVGTTPSLPLHHGINPLYRDAVEAFAADIAPLNIPQPAATLDAAAWQSVTTVFSSLGALVSRLDANMAGRFSLDDALMIRHSGILPLLETLIDRDLSYAPIAASLGSVEKALRLRTHFYTLLNNFVVFRDFYAPGRKAIFQAGTLYIDGRSCDLSLIVPDIDKHAAMAALAKTYLLYCRCVRRGGTETMTVAVAVTAGDDDNLMIGRNGLFYDRSGHDWDATVVRIIDFPISVRQAFWSPYKKLSRFISTQIEKFAQAKKEATESHMSGSAAASTDRLLAAAIKEEEKKTPPPPVDMGKFAGIFAAVGLALGAIGTAIASIVTGFMALPAWQMPVVLAGMILAVSGPSMLLAWLKLQARNLAPLLDAIGWAVNTKAKINIPFGATLTQIAHLPTGSSRITTDPYEEKSYGRYAIVIFIALGAALASYFLYAR